MDRRVLITGVGPVTPIGIGKENYWSSLIAGKSGARKIDFKNFDMEQYSTKIACTVDDNYLRELIGASGGIEVIATALMIENGKIHPTLNFETAGEGCDLNYVPGQTIDKQIFVALKNSFGFGGQNASLLLEKYDS